MNDLNLLTISHAEPNLNYNWHNLLQAHLGKHWPIGGGNVDTERQDLICPRCGHGIPDDESPGEYSGAFSRTRTGVEICSACGLHEAFLGYRRGVPIEEEWPVVVPASFYR